MEIVITMAGLGSRFRKAGYDVPKYMIEALGKTLFEWSMESLKGYMQDNNGYYFIVRKEDDSSAFIYSMCEKMGIKQAKVIELDHTTDGQATTAMLCRPYWKKDEALMIYNIDTYVEAYEMKLEDIDGDGYLPCFHEEGDHWSFVRCDESYDAIEVREKVRISDNCTLGAYYFKSCSLYEKLYDEYYGNGDNLEKGEKYVAPLYNHMISNGYKVRISIIDNKKVHVLGTPEELKDFIDGYKKEI